MAGYIGRRRSNNSLRAIEHFEMPLSMINKDVLIDLKEELKSGYYEEVDDKIFDLSVSIWKYAAQELGSSSWHHTGKYFNQTDHYDLTSVAEYLTEHIETIKDDYRAKKAKEKQEKESKKKVLEVGYIKYQEWGGSFRRPKLIGEEIAVGYIDRSGKKDWLVAYNAKFDINANKVICYETFDNLKDLKAKCPEKIDLRKFKKYLRNEGFSV